MTKKLTKKVITAAVKKVVAAKKTAPKKVAMTDEEKRKMRVAVAKDVIKQLDSNNMEATPGKYCVIRTEDMDGNEINFSKDSKTAAKQALDQVCEVCAKGAAFLSLVRIDNKFNLNKLINDRDRGYSTVEFKHPDIIKRLLDIFSRPQIDLIESFFEGQGMGVFEGNTVVSNNADNFLQDHYSENDRMEEIMANIIVNKGFFIPDFAKVNIY